MGVPAPADMQTQHFGNALLSPHANTPLDLTQRRVAYNRGTWTERRSQPYVSHWCSPPPLWHARQGRGTAYAQAAPWRLQISRLLAGTPPAGSTTPLRMVPWKAQSHTEMQLCITSASGGVSKHCAAHVRLQLPSTMHLHNAQRHAAQPRRWVLWGSIVLVPPKRKRPCSRQSIHLTQSDGYAGANVASAFVDRLYAGSAPHRRVYRSTPAAHTSAVLPS